MKQMSALHENLTKRGVPDTTAHGLAIPTVIYFKNQIIDQRCYLQLLTIGGLPYPSRLGSHCFGSAQGYSFDPCFVVRAAIDLQIKR